MRKKHFLGKALATAMMLICLGFGLTSCELDNSDNPVPAPAEPTNYTITANGASFTVNSVADVTDLLEQVKANIAEKGGSEFVIDITGALTTTSDNNTITLPDLSGYNITFNFASQLTTSDAPLTVKQNGEATTIYKNKASVNFTNSDVDLVLDLPGTTVTLNSLNSLQILNGMSIVKDGATVKTFVWAPIKNDYWMNNGDSEWVEVTDADGNSSYYPNVQPEKQGDEIASYKFKNLKIVKGKADYARVEVYDNAYALDKLTIAEGATVVLNYYPYIKEIVGEGNGAIVKSGDVSWGNTEEKLVRTDINLYEVEKIGKITFEPFLDGEYKDGTLDYAAIYQTPANMEGNTFKFNSISFRNPESASATVKNCKFEGVTEDKEVSINVPYQSEEITGFKFTFDGCEFAKGTKFATNVETSKPKLGSDGKQEYKTYYRWWTFTEDGNVDWDDWNKNRSESLNDVPAAAQEIGECNGGWDSTEGKSQNGYSLGYWTEKEYLWENVDFKDYYINVVFTSCKYDGTALTAENFTLEYQPTIKGAYMRYEFDGKTYRAIYDEESEKYLLISVSE